MKKARHPGMSGLRFKQSFVGTQGLLAVGKGQAACGFSVV